MIDHKAAYEVLNSVFGYTSFRLGQEEIIDKILNNKSLLSVMPTGAGKSICYQISSLLKDGFTVVISPLISLMEDQVAGLNGYGIEAACIHSNNNRDENISQWLKIKEYGAKLLYMSPERLMTDRMLQALENLPVNSFVIDEAHCISKWGNSFRPDYEQLEILKRRFPKTSIAGFTATADEITRSDIAEKLFDQRGEIILHGFDRPNLYLSVISRKKWKEQLRELLLKHQNESGIIYCLSRKFTEEVATHLLENDITAITYHAGLESHIRKEHQDRFMSETCIMVATIAFGMGIDKPDIRFVCHLNLPSNMESYYQEIGRAGRDGEFAETLLIYGLDDIKMRRIFIDDTSSDDKYKQMEHRRLDTLIAYCETVQCRRIALLSYFGEKLTSCGNCDNCQSPLSLINATKQARTLIHVIASTGEKFGKTHIVDILRGKNNQRVLSMKHNLIPNFGAYTELSQEYWNALIRQAVATNLLALDIRHGSLKLTKDSLLLLNGDSEFSIKEYVEVKSSQKLMSKPIPKTTNEYNFSSDDLALVSKLKALRLNLAKEKKVPAYVIFPDRTLFEMVRIRPLNLLQMSNVSGVGPKKLDDYGTIFLDEISKELLI